MALALLTLSLNLMTSVDGACLICEAPWGEWCCKTSWNGVCCEYPLTLEYDDAIAMKSPLARSIAENKGKADDVKSKQPQ